MEIHDILQKATAAGASDIFLVAGLPVTFKCGGRQQRLTGEMLMPESIRSIVDSIYETG